MFEILRDYGIILLIGDYPHGPVGGLVMTLILSVLGLALSFPSALAVALARTSGIKWLEWSATGFAYVVRSVPLLLVIFWVYYFLPVVTGIVISPFATVLFSIVVYQTAYLSEVIRAAIQAVPSGQTEAAQALGLKYVPITFRIVLPQALQNAIPGMISQFIIVIKETSLGYILAFNELTYAAVEVNAILLTRPIEVYLILAAMYFCICYSLSAVASHVEARLARKDARA